MSRHVYTFGGGQSDGHAGLEHLLGTTGVNLCEISRLGLPVPPGFCVPAVAEEVDVLSSEVDASISEAVARTGHLLSDTVLGDRQRPLLLSVTTSAADEVQQRRPHETVWNLGLNDDIVEAMAWNEGQHFAWDSYRRLIFSFACVVKRLNMEPFQQELDQAVSRLDAKCRLGRKHDDCDIPTSDLKFIVEIYKELYEEQTGEEFPQDPRAQLEAALRAVMKPGIAAVVQGMVFGNYSPETVAGAIILQKDNTSGWKAPDEDLEGEWLKNAQTSDVFAGVREPLQVPKHASRNWAQRKGISEGERSCWHMSLEEEMPSVYAKLVQHKDALEYRFSNEMQSEWRLDFVVDRGVLWILRVEVQPKRPASEVPSEVVPATASTAPPAPCDNLAGVDSEADEVQQQRESARPRVPGAAQDGSRALSASSCGSHNGSDASTAASPSPPPTRLKAATVAEAVPPGVSPSEGQQVDLLPLSPPSAPSGRRRTQQKRPSVLLAPLPVGQIMDKKEEPKKREQQNSSEVSDEIHTTVLLRCLPPGFTRGLLVKTLDEVGCAGRYNFVYLPVDFARGATFDYALVNLVTPEAASELISRLEGFRDWLTPSDRVCQASLSSSREGLMSMVERYRNSPVMHPNVPDEYKPAMYQDGQRVAFPAPTKWIRFPRIRHLKA